MIDPPAPARSRGDRIPLLLLMFALGLAAAPARADFIYYSWSGQVQPATGAGDPWGLGDGMPLEVRALVPADAPDLNGSGGPDFAQFAPILLLGIGDEIAAVSNPLLEFSDDSFGTLDMIVLNTTAEILGTPLPLLASVRIPIGSYALSDTPAPDPPPVFADTPLAQVGAASNQDLRTFPDVDATVTGRLQICGDDPIPVAWSSTTAGSAGDIAVTIDGLVDPTLSPGDFEFQGADFAAGPLCSITPQLVYRVGSDWTATLEEPVGALLVYAKAWRGTGAGAPTVTYRFDAPFTIVSGFAEASVGEGNTLLSLPGTELHDGILRFEGPISSLGVDANVTSGSFQVMTLAVAAPEPGAAATALAALATLLGVLRRSSRASLAALAIAGSANAAGVVGNGTPESCTGPAFADALAGGGHVTFDCGSTSTTIFADTAVIADGTVTTIDGGGLVSLSGDSVRQLFHVLAGGDLTLRNLELDDGVSLAGGALRNEGAARLERVRLVSNRADDSGGAIYNDGTLHVVESEFLANSSTFEAGGAILQVAGSATIERSLLFANTAWQDGGAITAEGGTLVVTNTTLFDNAAAKGGGIFVRGGEVEIQNATLDGNRADNGGAIFLSGVTATVRNTVLSRSRDRGGDFEALECDGTGVGITSLGGNLASDGSCQLAGPGDRNATDPVLGPPQNNRGPTSTMLPLPGSPLIDGGVSEGCPPVDQRGLPRPLDGDDPDAIAQCDIGAVEVPEPAAAWIAAIAALGAIALARRRSVFTPTSA